MSFFLNSLFTKDITYLDLTELEILALRIQFVFLDCFIPRNGRLQRMAGITISKMPFVSLQKKRFAKLQTFLFSILPVLPNHHSQGIGLVHWATWFDIEGFIKLRDVA